ncbi:DpnII family type II restriction endonuclease [Streptococcus suis]|nr:DpnII family type II restriction endonuclease [Streptococcus suis]
MEFMWFTDGKGWHKAKKNLQETFEVLPHLYNTNDLKNNILKTLK